MMNNVDGGWQATAEAKPIMAALLGMDGKRRRVGLLEDPPNSHIDRAVLRAVFIGKARCGKTALIARLCGYAHYKPTSESYRIAQTRLYWPGVVAASPSSPLQFTITCVDGMRAMEASAARRDECLQGVRVVVCVFNVADRASWDVIPSLIEEYASGERICCIGTNADRNQHAVTQQEIDDFARRYECHTKIISSLTDKTGRAEIDEVTPIINSICDAALE